MKELNSNMEGDIGAYLLVHCGGRRLGIGDRIDEVAKQLKKEANGVPFLAIFTFGEYGVRDHGSNTTGGLMLSFKLLVNEEKGKKPQNKNNYICTLENYNGGTVKMCKPVNNKEGASVKNLIGYEWKDASNGATIEVVNPATQELIDTVPNVTDEDVDEAVKVAMIEQKKWEKSINI